MLLSEIKLVVLLGFMIVAAVIATHYLLGKSKLFRLVSCWTLAPLHLISTILLVIMAIMPLSSGTYFLGNVFTWTFSLLMVAMIGVIIIGIFNNKEDQVHEGVQG